MKNVILSLATTVALFLGTNLAHARDPHCVHPHRGPSHHGASYGSPYGSVYGSPYRAGYAPSVTFGGLNFGNLGGYSSFGPYGSGLTVYFGARPNVIRYNVPPTLNRACGCSPVHGPCHHHAGHAPPVYSRRAW